MLQLSVRNGDVLSGCPDKNKVPLYEEIQDLFPGQIRILFDGGSKFTVRYGLITTRATALSPAKAADAMKLMDRRQMMRTVLI